MFVAKLSKARILFFFLLFSLVFFTQAFSQSNKPQWWFTYNHTGRFADRWSYGFDLNYRTNGLVPLNSSLTAARMGINYHTNTGFRITAGYAWFGTFASQQDRIWLHENRLYEQVQFNHGSGKVNFTHRIRIEHRWRQLFTDASLGETDVFLTNRYRYLIQLDGPIPRNPERKTSLRWQVANEFFIHNQEDIGYMLFDQNRTLAGVMISPTKTTSLAVLYQLILQQQPYLRETRAINSIRITLFQSLDFRKKKTIIREEVPVVD
ncbi:hypothetical protein C943_02244 [Mariniradius saccharolyticus AK6]|uniref:DUF2490 domain-containing protein n=1 Tax=Mariniradius saccharolyticus AK6 TaxID=1239962 RepID=M7X9G4_9BACT|nr:DUF2490 domain-containing protein [Mariniradius saccharolyticus]EMS31589.1 hypothetical protein C943_02244 [Mariniradius saccharolyticus AK6]